MRALILILAMCATINAAGATEVKTTQKSTQNGGNFDSIGIGGSDYDIGNDVCRFHTGGLTFAFAPRDKVCEGLRLIRLGMIDAGVRHLCNQSPIRDNYPSFEDCQAEVGMVYGAKPEPSRVHHDEEQEYHEQQQQQLEEVITELEQLKANPPVVYRTDPELQRQLKADEERRRKAREALQGDDK